MPVIGRRGAIVAGAAVLTAILVGVIVAWLAYPGTPLPRQAPAAAIKIDTVPSPAASAPPVPAVLTPPPAPVRVHRPVPRPLPAERDLPTPGQVTVTTTNSW